MALLIELFVALLVELFVVLLVDPVVALFVVPAVPLFDPEVVELFDALFVALWVVELLVLGASVPQVPLTQYSPEKQSDCRVQVFAASEHPANARAAAIKVIIFILFSCQKSEVVFKTEDISEVRSDFYIR